MKTALLLICACSVGVLRAADETKLVAADRARIAATLSADRAGLEAILSDDLHYAHSSGKVDTKTSFIEAVTGGKLKYTRIAYDERVFTYPAPGLALMTGKAQVSVGGNDVQFSFLSVWREKKGAWRFLAWQSSKLTPPAPAPSK